MIKNISCDKIDIKGENVKFKRDFLLVPVIILVLIMVSGTFLFSYFEGWRPLDSLYFVVASITTIGYGDLTPTRDISKIISIIFNLTSIPMALSIFAILAEFYFEKRLNGLESHFKDLIKGKQDPTIGK